MPASGNQEPWSPTPIALVASGAAVIAGLKVAVIAAVLGIAAWALGTPELWTRWFVVGVTTVILVDAVAFVMRRRMSLLRHHDDPGGPGLAVTLLVAVPVAALATTIAVIGLKGGVVPFVVTIGILWASLVFIERPWRSGLTRDEVEERWAATKTMSRGHFAEDVDEYRRWRRDRARRERDR